ncbi:hypothetical protein EVAR_102933_1 [Eumeta japonica]|uniref:Uncharacterized protein n=1 Tax=Eumeta variegata TaxID=151549 RepID=A0A4C2A5L5_EUMVA|nr:hypothetical protein EVAR_102933_1 [Eumeta japonica]
MTSQTTLIASPSAAGRHMRVPTATCIWTTPGGSRLGIGMSQETVTGRFLLPPGRRRLAAAGWSGVRASGGSVRFVAYGYGWDAAVDSQPPRVSALGCDPAMSKNRFDASFIYLEIVGVLSPYGELNYEHTNVHPLRLYRIYSVLPVVYVVLLERRERRRETRMPSPS